MKLQLITGNDIVFFDKPAGFSVDLRQKGSQDLCDIVEIELRQKIYPVYQPDGATTGATLFAQTEKKSRELSQLILEQKIQRTYLFMTDQRSEEFELDAHSIIQKKGPHFQNDPSLPDQANAHTRFRRIKRTPFFELWEAHPMTDQTHQIRLHAAQVGLPILGDTLNGGSTFPHLCLHCQNITVPEETPWTSAPPRFFERMGLAKDPTLVQWLVEIDRRQRLYNFLKYPDKTLRLIHRPELRLDLFASQIWFYWFQDSLPNKGDLLRIEFIGELLGRPWFLQIMQDRGSNPHERQVFQSEDWQSQWTAKENNFLFELRAAQGQSPGLFLDQRRNRQLVFSKSKQRRILNLFSYTCGFSVFSALGGADQVTSVDVSGNFLDWGKTNLRLNQLDPSRYEFFVQDSLLFLKGSQKRGRLFDLIICDPPSFGRHKSSVFRLDKNLSELLQLCWSCLEDGGEMLFSCNLQKWSRVDLQTQIRKTLPKAKISLLSQDLDFETPSDESILKALWIQKRSVV